jgi:hypothetical protein
MKKQNAEKMSKIDVSIDDYTHWGFCGDASLAPFPALTGDWRSASSAGYGARTDHRKAINCSWVKELECGELEK